MVKKYNVVQILCRHPVYFLQFHYSQTKFGPNRFKGIRIISVSDYNILYLTKVFNFLRILGVNVLDMDWTSLNT